MSKQFNPFNPIFSSSIPLDFINWSLGLADDIIAVSGVTANVLKNEFNIQNPVIIPNGVDTNSNLSPYIGSQKNNSIIYLGRLSPEKCLPDLVNAVDHLRNNGNPDIQCKIVGEGSEKNKLIKLTKSLKLSNHIHFPGYVPEEIKHKELSSSDLFILPSKREGFSIATMEALNSGLPVIAAKPNHLESSGVFEYLVDGFNGYSYPVNDYMELSKTISFLLANPEKRRNLQQNAKETAKKYSWDYVIEEYLSHIEG